MSTFGITDAGFVLKRLADIQASMVARLSAIHDPDTGEFLTPSLSDENDPFIQFLNAVDDELSVCWEQLQLAYNQFDPSKATGAGLKGLVQLNGIKAAAGSFSTVPCTMTGIPNTYTPSGQQVATYDGKVVFTLPAWTFDGSGNAAVLGICTEEGPNAAPVGSVTKIVTPASGWISCTNVADATLGAFPETDTALRTKQKSSTTTTSSGPIDAIYGALTNVFGVTFARVYQNNTSGTDPSGRGIPPKCIAPVVLGGSDADIAAVLKAKGPPLGEYYGTTTINLPDAQSIMYAYSWTRPTQIPIYIAIALTVINSRVWPTDGANQIKAAILAYAQSGASGLGIDSGFDQTGYLPGQSIYASELYTPINSIPGAKVTSLAIGTTSSPASQEVDIPWNQVAEFDPGNIAITVS